ncbi:acylphosphatase [Novosphingobium sp. G106]|uniref:acylphosphatase n=1 Tax=Novosphingobium sp. G106 TaxID=2849500 RepID=UPI001C2DB21F|nr:acylphosphatase [Novosphingobium sp. G106]MBV1691389.1 acylphosphatase [Novosphingobium sp. G106]
MVAYRIFITGQVQGVFFREWTVSRAREIGVAGWVRNRSDGRVEVYAAGVPDQLDRLVEKLREGSPASQVDGLEIVEAPIEAVEAFVRRQTL